MEEQQGYSFFLIWLAELTVVDPYRNLPHSVQRQLLLTHSFESILFHLLFQGFVNLKCFRPGGCISTTPLALPDKRNSDPHGPDGFRKED